MTWQSKLGEFFFAVLHSIQFVRLSPLCEFGILTPPRIARCARYAALDSPPTDFRDFGRFDVRQKFWLSNCRLVHDQIDANPSGFFNITQTQFKCSWIVSTRRRSSGWNEAILPIFSKKELFPAVTKVLVLTDILDPRLNTTYYFCEINFKYSYTVAQYNSFLYFISSSQFDPLRFFFISPGTQWNILGKQRIIEDSIYDVFVVESLLGVDLTQNYGGKYKSNPKFHVHVVL